MPETISCIMLSTITPVTYVSENVDYWKFSPQPLKFVVSWNSGSEESWLRGKKHISAQNCLVCANIAGKLFLCVWGPAQSHNDTCVCYTMALVAQVLFIFFLPCHGKVCCAVVLSRIFCYHPLYLSPCVLSSLSPSLSLSLFKQTRNTFRMCFLPHE